MSLLGIDVGTMGCKSTLFTPEGKELASAYREYNFISGKEGYAELDSNDVWRKIKETIREVTARVPGDPVTALSASSMGEAMVPVTRDKKILDNSILGNDIRGEEFMEGFLEGLSPESVFKINGNIPDIFFSYPKLAWIKKYNPGLYEKADYFLLWADLVGYMLGGSPVTNYSHASRTLLFDAHARTWSDKLMKNAGLEPGKFAQTIPSGTPTGCVTPDIARELNLGTDVVIVSGGHDQCCAALGCGIAEGSNDAMYGFGTYICIVPVFRSIPDMDVMFRNGLNYENHVIADRYVSFVFNLSGGALIRWYRNTFGRSGLEAPGDATADYDFLFGEISGNQNEIIVIPRFGPTGAPDFLRKNAGTISGLSLQNTRGDILQAMLEGITFYFRDFFSDPHRDIYRIDNFVATGGGSKSPVWLQTTADIMNKPVIRNRTAEAGTLGAAILAGAGSKVFSNVSEGINTMISRERIYYPDLSKSGYYADKFEQYKKLYAFLKNG